MGFRYADALGCMVRLDCARWCLRVCPRQAEYRVERDLPRGQAYRRQQNVVSRGHSYR